MKTNKIKQVRMLYSLFAAILLACLLLFFFNVIDAAESDQIFQLPQTEDSRHTFFITDLIAAEPVYAEALPVEDAPEGLGAKVHVSQYTAEFSSDRGRFAGDPRATWIMVLQWFAPLALLAIVVLAMVALGSFYRSAKRGQVFPLRQVSLLVVIGLLIMAVSLSADTRAFLERRMAADLLEGTDWVPQVAFTIHFSNIFFGLTMIFVALIFKIGREMQEDQELTI